MPESPAPELGEHGWLHVPFLEHGEFGDAGASERALGAFLVLRAADGVHLARGIGDARAGQIHAAREYLEGLSDRSSPEIQHLEAILRAAAAAGRSGRLPEALVAFSDWLEGEFRLREALDVLDTALAIGDAARDAAVQCAVLLRRGRTLRVAGHLNEARSAYGQAGSLAKATGDSHRELLSRIGRAIVLQQLGNLPAANALLCDVINDAVLAGDRDARARATHDLAVNHLMQGEPDQGAILAFRAYQLYSDTEGRYRALSDAGIALEELGHDSAAHDAFQLVFRRGPSVGIRVRVGLELLGLAGKRGDRAAFDARRRSLDAIAAEMPPRVAVDFDIKLGHGYARFGRTSLARHHFEMAIARAEQHHLNELLFRAEQGLQTLGRATRQPPQRIDWATRFPEVAEVAETLRALLID